MRDEQNYITVTLTDQETKAVIQTLSDHIRAPRFVRDEERLQLEEAALNQLTLARATTSKRIARLDQ